MKGQAFNPFLPGYEYIPDGEPRLFGERVYLYGSHDKFDGISFCLNDYVCWSAPADDLSDWRCEGVIYRRRQDPDGKRGFLHALYAPDVCRGADGRYYLYYFIGYKGLISVAVCDTPAGRYEYLGHVKYADGVLLGRKKEPLPFDPGVFADDDGKFYLYIGFGPVDYPAFLLGGREPSRHGPMGFELEADMLTIRRGPVYIGVKGKTEGKGTPYEGHEFFEAASLRKFEGKYYFVYSSFKGHELCYAVSDSPLGGFGFGGTLVSIGDVGIGGRTEAEALNYLGNTHGSILRVKDTYYVFYHRQTNRHQFSRQACAEQIVFDGEKFRQAEVTSCGLNGGPLAGAGYYEARIACLLYSKKGARRYGVFKGRKGRHPYFTQSGRDREQDSDQYIENFCDGATAVFKYFSLRDLKEIAVSVAGRAEGTIEVRTDRTGKPCAEIPVRPRKTVAEFAGQWSGPDGIQPLYFTFRGKGGCRFVGFTLR